MKHLDLTPTWRAILPTWLMMYRQAVLGDCTDPDLVKANARAEFEQMALAADRWNAFTAWADETSLPISFDNFAEARPDLFPKVDGLDEPDLEPAYSREECPDCGGTGRAESYRDASEQTADTSCERCSGAGGWLSCNECGEPEDEPHSADCSHKPGASL